MTDLSGRYTQGLPRPARRVWNPSTGRFDMVPSGAANRTVKPAKAAKPARPPTAPAPASSSRRALAALEKTVSLAVAGLMPPEVQKVHAAMAREILAKHLAAVKGDAPTVTRIIDGHKGASEDTVKPYGLIRYEFAYASTLREAAAFALAEVRSLSPKKTGRYADRWQVMADGAVVPTTDRIPPAAKRVIIVNPEPYSRRLEVGRDDAGLPFVVQVPPLFTERAAAAVKRVHGQRVRVSYTFVKLPSGPADMTFPAVLIERRA